MSLGTNDTRFRVKISVINLTYYIIYYFFLFCLFMICILLTGKCDGLRCVECEEDHHCPSHQYCKNKNVPLVLNRCKNKKYKGWCSRSAMCQSGRCRWLRCKKP